MHTIAELHAHLLELNTAVQDIRARAEVEDRDLTEDEEHGIDVALREFDQASAKLERLKRIEAQTLSLSEPAAAVTPEPAAQAAGTPMPRVEIIERRGTNGFAHMGEFALSVQRAGMPGAQVDPRLIANQPTNVGDTQTPAEGGYAVPPDFRDAIVNLMADDNRSLLALTDAYTTAYNKITFPTDPDPKWSASGIQAYWTAEAAKIQDSPIALGQKEISLHKLAALVPVTDELLADAPGINSYLNRKTPEVMLWEINSALISGDGAGKPQGILQSPAAIAVPRDTSGSILYEDITGLWVRMPAQWRPGAVWMANPDVEAELLKLTFFIKNAAGSENVGGEAVYLPAGNVAGSPFGTLFGRPVIFHEAMPGLNAAGDLTFVAWDQYASATKAGGGLRSDVSIHLYFDYDIATFRFIIRVGGETWHDAPITSPSTTTRSSVVTLAAGA